MFEDIIKPIRKRLEQIRDERNIAANTAKRVCDALLSILSLFEKGVFLRNDIPDKASGTITFLKGLLVGNGSYGFNDKGKVTSSDITNHGDVFTKNITVTGKMTVFELEIERAKSVGGLLIISPADFRIDAVDNIIGGWRCYMLAMEEAGNGTTRVVKQMWQPGDQAFCQSVSLNVGNVDGRYYWRAVTAVSTANVVRDDGKEYLFIDLSDTDCDVDSVDAPAIGDNLVLLGNHALTDINGDVIVPADETRQGAEVLSAYKSIDLFLADKAPYKAQYWGIDDYDLTSHLKTYFARGKNHIVGDIDMTTESTIAGKSLGDTLKGLEKNIEAAKAQSDRQIVLWFGDETPTLANEPYILWVDDTERTEHVGDIYYNRSKTDVTAGHAYEFARDESGVFFWDEITDSDVLYSLELASQAQRDATAARNEAEAAVRAIDAMADDNILSVPEKQRLGRELASLWTERYGSDSTQGLDADGRSTGVGTEKYDSAFDSLTRYLNDGMDWTGSKDIDGILILPSMLSADGDTEIDGKEFMDRWTCFYACRTELINAIAKSHIRCFAGIPQPPYKRGDLWVNATWPLLLAAGEEPLYDNDTLVCVQGRYTGDKFNIDDWQPQQEYTTKTIAKQFQMQDKIASIICGENSLDDIQNIIKASEDWRGLVNGLFGLRSDFNTSIQTINTTFSTIQTAITDSEKNITGYVRSNFLQYTTDKEGGLKLFASYTDDEGNPVNTAALTLMASADGSKLKLTADNLILEGLVTANGNFKILPDGSIVSKNASLTGNFYSEDVVRGNKIIINAEDGYLKMTGPSSVMDEDWNIPGSDERIDLFKVEFDTDADSLGRFAKMTLGSGSMDITIEPKEGRFACSSKNGSILWELSRTGFFLSTKRGWITLDDEGLSFHIGEFVKEYKGLVYNFDKDQYE